MRNRVIKNAILGPMIRQHFSRALLLTPAPRTGDCYLNLYAEFQYVKWYFLKKSKSGKIKKGVADGLRIIEELERQYEWIKAKEKEIEGQEGRKTNQWFYYVRTGSKEDFEVHGRFRNRGIPTPVPLYRGDCAFRPFRRRRRKK